MNLRGPLALLEADIFPQDLIEEEPLSVSVDFRLVRRLPPWRFPGIPANAADPNFPFLMETPDLAAQAND